ncbi:MAG TPA: tyrosine-type recombinase/integrase [Terriglobia bacterium]|nr:tyrosine-type recombinase/integrase [Terriglobia bacterium]
MHHLITWNGSPGCRRAEIASFTWHSLRHSFASRLVMACVGLRTVQKMGHKTIAMTCRYAHLAPEHRLDAVRKLDETDTRTSTTAFQTPQGTSVAQSQTIGQ